MISIIYLDSASFSKSLPCALEAYRNAPFGNPSSSHAVGQAARESLEDARRRIAKCLDCEPDELYFTSTATEAAKLALYSLEKTGKTVLPSGYEHHSVSENCTRSVDLIRSEGEAVSATMLVNNEVGALLPKPPSPPYAYWVCDATAAVGHSPASFRNLGCDYLIADAIKFGGLPGAAILVVRNGAPLSPLIYGGGQERGMRAGTENVPAICAMAAALEWHTERMAQETAYITHLRDLFLDCLDNSGIAFTVNTPLDKCIPHILNVSFPGCEGTALSLLMSERGVMCSAGAACSNGKNEPSHVLMAMFNDEERARSALRFSFSHDNKDMDIIKAVMILAEEVKKLSALSAH